MKAYKLEVLILDFDGLGEQGVVDALEGGRFSNRCISPDVRKIESREVEWHDDHPLNKTGTTARAYQELFADKPVIEHVKPYNCD